VIGATVDGYIDYTRNDVRMRGTFVPLYGLNNMFGQSRSSGSSSAAATKACSASHMRWSGRRTHVLRVNPISAVAPGLLRKFFEFPSGNGSHRCRRATPSVAKLTTERGR